MSVPEGKRPASGRRSPLRTALDAAGLLLAAVLAWWAWTRADPHALAAAFRGGERTWLAVAAATLLTGHALRVLRWSSLCAGAGSAPGAALVAGPVGLLAVTLLPFRLGEGVRLALQRRLDAGAGLPRLVGLTLIERAGDLLGILLLVALGAAAAGSYLPAAGLACGVAVGAAVVRGAERLGALQLEGRLRLQKLAALVLRLARTVLAQRPAALARVALLSVVAWFGDAVAIFALARAFGAAVEPGAAAAAAGWVALGVALPTAPAGLGTHQAVMAWALGGAVSFEAALAISLAMLALIVFAQALLTAAALASLLLRAGAVRRQQGAAGGASP